MRVRNATNVTASQVARVTAGPSLPNVTSLFGSTQVESLPLPPYRLTPGQTIRSGTDNLSAGDQYSNIYIQYTMFPV